MALRHLLPAVLSLGLALGPTLPAAAQELTDDERDAFRDEVRAYLLEHPEVLMEAIGVLEQREREAQQAADQALASAYSTDLSDDGFSFVGGNPEGDVVLVEFMDYRCGFCRQAFAEVEELVESDGNIRFVLKEFPILGEQSMLASRFAIATQIVEGEDAYKDVHDALMTINSDISIPTLTRLGEGLALDVPAILDTMESDAITERLNANRALAGALQITGTPTLVMNDQMLRGYLTLPQMQQIIAQLRADG